MVEPNAGPRRELSRGRIALAMLLGHLAAAGAFALCFMLGAAAANAVPLPRSAADWWGAARAAAWFPALVLVMGAFTAVLMAPMSLLTAPATWILASELRTGASTTAAIGAAIGVVDVILMLWWQGTFSAGPNHAPDPLTTLVTFGGCAAAAGAAYGTVVWRLCIRPRLDRHGAARWRESV